MAWQLVSVDKDEERWAVMQNEWVLASRRIYTTADLPPEKRRRVEELGEDTQAAIDALLRKASLEGVLPTTGQMMGEASLGPGAA